MSAAVVVRVVPKGLHFSPAGYLGEEWGAYQAAVGRLRFVESPSKGYLARDPEHAATAVAALQGAGFEVRATVDALAVLERGTEVLRARASQAAASVDRARGRLAERGADFRGDFQAQGVEFLNGRRSALLLDDMGLGKTAQSVLGVDPNTPVVVACPSSVVGAWIAEVERWTELAPCTLKSAAAFVWPVPGAVLVVTHDRIPPCAKVVRERLADFCDAAFRWVASVVAGLPPPRVPAFRTALPAPAPPPNVRVVLDEVHAFKAPKSDRTRNAKALVKDVLKADGSALGLSGTVIQNRPGELKAVLDVLDLFQESFGSWRRFAEAFGGEIAVRSSEAKATPAVAEALSRVALRRTADEVLPDLPPLSVEVRWIPLDGRAAELAASIEAIIRARVADVERDVGRPLTAAEHERALADAIEASSEIGAVSAARKVIALAVLSSPEVQAEIAACEAAREPVVVACTNSEPVAVLGERPGWVRIVGDVPQQQRTQNVAKFQSSEAPGIAVSIRAGGNGITLTRANRMLFINRDWNPAQNAQMMKRIHRIGQTRPCQIIVFAADCWVEHHVDDLCTSKTALASDSLDALVGRAPGAVALPDLGKVRLRESAQPYQTQQEATLEADTGPAGDVWLTVDDALRGRLERLAAAGVPLARWLLSMHAKHGSIPSRVAPAGQPKRPTLDLLVEAERVTFACP